MEEDQMVQEWVHGLPSADDLTPLSQPLITPELAAAFGVSPEAQRSLLDVHSSSQETFETLRLKKALPLPSERKEDDKVTATTAEDDDEDERTEKEAEEGGTSGRAVKRPRLLWTPHLHRRFVEVVAHLGAKKAVPKAIMQLMNVDGLTRENVASHLQKYRLYLKRVSGEEDEEAAAEDNPPLTAPSSSYAAAGRPAVIPVPVLGGGAPFGMVPGPVAGGHYPLLAAAHRPYPVYWQPGGNKMGSNSTVHRIK